MKMRTHGQLLLLLRLSCVFNESLDEDPNNSDYYIQEENQIRQHNHKNSEKQDHEVNLFLTYFYVCDAKESLELGFSNSSIRISASAVKII